MLATRDLLLDKHYHVEQNSPFTSQYVPVFTTLQFPDIVSP